MASPDVLVTIEPPAEAALRVVQVEGDDTRHPDRGIERCDRPVITGGGAEIVACSEGMLGIETDAQAVAVGRLVEETAEVLEPPADLRPLPGRVLERDRGAEAAAGGQDLAQRARSGPQAGVLAGTTVRSGMRDEVADAEPLAAFELRDQLADGARAEVRHGRGDVEEIGVVREHGVDSGRLARGREGADLVLRERPRRPLARRAREELDRLAPGGAAPLERAVQAARDRLVRAEQRAGRALS